MAETTADVRKDIELTRTRISETLQELEQKMNVTQIVKNNPWPALAIAVGAGVLLSGSRADVKAAAVTVVATKAASGRTSSVLDELVAQVVHGFQSAIEHKIERLANDVKRAFVAPTSTAAGSTYAHSSTDASTSAPATRAD
ncbi:MAG: DUF3618 domain-containing protein [bacterium]